MLNSLGHRKPGLGKDTYSQGFNDLYETKGVNYGIKGNDRQKKSSDKDSDKQ
tara:strand:- start:286 stop:441 length:156 start_codon:yes stop_codon:yes gene_type:complete